MKNFFLFWSLILTIGGCVPISEEDKKVDELYENLDDEVVESTEFDEDLADELGADEYGMKRYIFANLVEGPIRDQNEREAARLQRAHLDNITRLAEAGKLVLAGPFLDDGEVRGLYIFDVETIAEAERLTRTDPAIRAGRLKMELRPWYGTAALLKVNEIAKTVVEKGI